MQVFCKHCSQTHPSFEFELPEEIGSNQCVADVYEGREVPSIIGVVLSNRLTCPDTGRNYGDDPAQSFLIKVTDT